MKAFCQREASAIRAINQANMARLPTFGGARTGIGPNSGPFWPDSASKVYVEALSGRPTGHCVRIGSSRTSIGSVAPLLPFFLPEWQLSRT